MTTPTTERPTADSGDEQPMDIADLMPQLTAVSAGHVDAGITAVLGRINELRTKAKTDGLTEAEAAEAKQRRAEWDQLTAEKSRRATAQAEVDAAFDGVPDDEPAEQADEPAADGTSDTTETSGDEQPTEQPQEAVAASAGEAPKLPRLPLGTVTRDRAPQATSTGNAQAPTAAIVAAAGDRNHQPGSTLDSAELSRAIHDRARSIGRGSGGAVPDDYVTVATIERPRLDERYLESGNELGNTHKLEAVTEPTALTAAGVCAPYVIDYSIGTVGIADRPVRDAFPAFTADRGGIQFRRDVDALGSGPRSASGTWSLATDADPQSNTKPIWEVSCNSVVSAEVTAVTLGTKFSNITGRFDPEAVAANTRAAEIAHSRYADVLLLNSMYAQSTATMTQAKQVSAARDLLGAIDRAQAYIRNNRRQGGEVTLRTFLPMWVRDGIRLDMVRALHTSNEEWLGLSNAAIEQWFTNRNISVTWLLDGRSALTAVGTSGQSTYIPAIPDQNYTPATGVGLIPSIPSQVEFPLFVEGTFVFLDGGELNVGVVRDENLVKTNRYIQFQETFEGLYRRGVESLRLVVEFVPQGASAGTITTTSLTG